MDCKTTIQNEISKRLSPPQQAEALRVLDMEPCSDETREYWVEKFEFWLQVAIEDGQPVVGAEKFITGLLESTQWAYEQIFPDFSSYDDKIDSLLQDWA